MLNFTKGRLAIDGQRKKLYETREEGVSIMQFKDEEKSLIELATHQRIEGSSTVNNAISAFIMRKMNALNIATHFIRQVNMREQAIHTLEMFPFSVTIRNYATGVTLQKIGSAENVLLPVPLIEYTMPTIDAEGNSQATLISPGHLQALGWLYSLEAEEIEHTTRRINDFLTGLFSGAGLTLAAITLSFGRYLTSEGDDPHIMLGGEITPRTCLLWEDNLESDQKHRYISEIEVADRLGLLPQCEGRQAHTPLRTVTEKESQYSHA